VIGESAVAARYSDLTRLMAAALALALAACTAPAAPGPMAGLDTVPLPPMQGAGDPMRATVTSAAYAFADTRRLDGQPAEAARAVARLEWLATELPADPTWNAAAPMIAGLLRQGRDEVRGTIGIPPALPADAVARAMIEAAAALDAGNRQAGAAALAPVAGGQPAALLARLDRLPQSRAANAATALAHGEFIRLGRDTGLDE
jgi:hypothetical protein